MAFGITPVPETLVIPRGATWQHTITVKNNGVPVDLTSGTAEMIARPRFLDEKVIDLATGGSGITLGGVNGTILMELTDAQTLALDPTKFPMRYTLRVRYADLTYDNILDGVVELIAGTLVP